jgi:hypothetical protein
LNNSRTVDIIYKEIFLADDDGTDISHKKDPDRHTDYFNGYAHCQQYRFHACPSAE